MSALNKVVNKLWYGGDKNKALANELTAEFSKVKQEQAAVIAAKDAEIERLRALVADFTDFCDGEIKPYLNRVAMMNDDGDALDMRDPLIRLILRGQTGPK